MNPELARATVLAPMAWVPRRGSRPRIGLLPVDVAVPLARIAPSDAPLLMVHAGQGRSHARPIHAVGDRLFTPVVRTEGREVVPRPGSELVEAASSAAGLAALAADRDAATALLGCPLMPATVASDPRFPVIDAGGLDGARILHDGRDAAREAGRSWFRDDVRFAGEAVLVAMGGPLLHLDRDLWTLRVSLNPAMVDPRTTAMPVLHPYRDELDLAIRLANAGIARGPLLPAVPSLDHLDPNPARPPLDLKALRRRPDEERRAALATARLSPLQALLLAAPSLRAEATPEGLARAAFDVALDRAYALVGQPGPGGYGDVLLRAAALVADAGRARPGPLPGADAYLAELAARTAPLRPEPPDADREALSSLAPGSQA